MSLQLYNTLTRKKEEFIPLNKKQVNMYVCGPTVYNFFHIGNARPFLVFEVLRRYLKYKKYKVKYVSNFTDIDDKIINKAKELGSCYLKVVEKYINEYFQDADFLNIGRADYYPRATEHIIDIINFIQKLEEKGYTYVVEGDVFYDVNKFKDYGKLSKQSLNEIQVGARIEIDERKKNPYDFILWKRAKEGEPKWDSPWGPGRPGWHIECSVMSTKYLGESFDIHAGGEDLIFPHHENEIAQSEAVSGKPFAKYWLHNGYLKIDDKKMSKSLDNILTIRELSHKYDGSVIRHFLLSAHYRSPLNYSLEQMEQSKNSMETLINTFFNLNFLSNKNHLNKGMDIESKKLIEKVEKMEDIFIKAMDDDFNTPVALSTLYLLSKETNIYLNEARNKNMEAIVKVIQFYENYGVNILGLKFISQSINQEQISRKEIEKLINVREIARKNKDWITADQIREKLNKMGILIEDTVEGVRWKKT
ncbi:MAG: cysteine--tRNA ligase [Atribacterota bacterium]|nr:cysteine--tRNA ligase [Atribacterota bacterium]MDD4895989.1 cysteine--tRNA ligase [Atribacterota bacterium]MDD5636448.1 cysteine--tRNA ligase [Atribacterota bacterium]